MPQLSKVIYAKVIGTVKLCHINKTYSVYHYTTNNIPFDF